jgi:hypothetical protein
METKAFYDDEIWESIVSDPEFTLGRRELAALLRFLPDVAGVMPGEIDILHLGIGNGREIQHFIGTFPRIGTYLVNDIREPVLTRVVEGARSAFPGANIVGCHGDMEEAGTIPRLRSMLGERVLVVLVANSVIYSNTWLDRELAEALRPEDRFMLTLELPHDEMSRSYVIEPVYKLLSHSGLPVNAANTDVWYDDATSCLMMTYQGRKLLAAYKPTLETLRARIARAGMREVLLRSYDDLLMSAGLFAVQA